MACAATSFHMVPAPACLRIRRSSHLSNPGSNCAGLHRMSARHPSTTPVMALPKWPSGDGKGGEAGGLLTTITRPSIASLLLLLLLLRASVSAFTLNAVVRRDDLGSSTCSHGDPPARAWTRDWAARWAAPCSGDCCWGRSAPSWGVGSPSSKSCGRQRVDYQTIR